MLQPSTISRFLKNTAKVLVCIYLLILVALMFFEEVLIFPAPNVADDQWQQQLQQEDVRFTSADGTELHGWYFPVADPEQSNGTLLYSHGNGDCVAYLGPLANSLRNQYGLNVLVYDYRGYGKSEGKPTGAGVLADGEAARQWLAERENIPIDEIILMGRSLGGGVAVHLAANGGARGLILESTFTRLSDVAARQFPWLPVRLVMRTRIDSIDKIGSYNGPLLQSHGNADSLIPFEQGKALFEAASGSKTFVELDGLNHNDHQTIEYYEKLGEFLNDI